jgi:hypothetical protein
MVDTPGLQHQRRPCERAAAAQDAQATPGEILRHPEEVTGNIALTCRYSGIGRQLFYKWRHRYDRTAWRDSGTAPASRRNKRHLRRWQRREKPLPGHRVRIDVKFITRRWRASRRTHYLVGGRPGQPRDPHCPSRSTTCYSKHHSWPLGGHGGYRTRAQRCRAGSPWRSCKPCWNSSSRPAEARWLRCATRHLRHLFP